MNLIQTQMGARGHDYWREYIRMHGLSVEPTDDKLMQLARELNVQFTYMRSCIAIFLSNRKED